MGFIASGDSTTLSAYLTQRGRELLLNGTETDVTAVYFAVGDSDTNYKIQFNLTEGFVPDLTGDDTDCVVSLANNIGIKYPVSYNTAIISAVTNSQVMFRRADNNQYYNVLDCLIHLDSIGRYQLYNSSQNKSNPNRLKLNNILQSPFVDLFSQVAILSNPNATPAAADFAPPDSMVFEMQFDPSIYSKINNTYLTSTATTITQTSGNKSPLLLTFSSSATTGGNVLYGAGKCSIGIYNREIGYLYKADTGTSYSFAPASQTEGSLTYSFYTDSNNAILNQYTDFTLAAQIYSKDDSTGQIRKFVYRGDQNLSNISDSLMTTYSNELKFANQYAKLFDNDLPVVDGQVSSVSLPGLMTREINNLRDFIQTSGLFSQTVGTNEYRTSKLTFLVYPKTSTINITPATLNIILSYNDDVLLAGDADTTSISDQGNGVFVEYDFVSTNGIFTNKIKNGTFQKNNCNSGQTGSFVTYSVSAATYTGLTQSAADTLAQNDVNANGQNYANTHGTCSITQVYSSSIFAQYVQKTNCGVGYSGSSVYVTFPAGQFTSTISQADANQQAVNAAQIQANTNGTCSHILSGFCLVVGQKIITDDIGGRKNVEDLVVGDYVYTFTEDGSKHDFFKVIQTFGGTVDTWLSVKTFGGREIKCTPSHLLMIGYNLVKQAQELTLEDELLYVEEGDIKRDRVKSVTINNESIDIYNIEVEEAHTYFTDNHIWHHNKPAPISLV